jgi:hypothetical protein
VIRQQFTGFALTALITSACSGDIGGGFGAPESPPVPTSPSPAREGDAGRNAPDGSPASACRGDQPRVGASHARRLTRHEYNNTVRDLLGITSRPADLFPPETKGGLFSNDPAGQSVGADLGEKQFAAAEAIAARAVENLATLLPCDPAKGEDACARTFIKSFGRKAFRRPLTTGEEERLWKVFSTGRQSGFRDGVRVTLTTILFSPNFLYRIEGGAAPAKATSWEIASRLSYLVWASTPDDALLTAAEANRLSTPQQINEQLDRLLKDPRARDGVAPFLSEWAEVDRFADIEKDGNVYAGFSSALAALFEQETTLFLRDVWDNGTLQTLLTAPYSYMNKPLAAHHGITGPAGATFERVALDPKRASGLLTQTGLLSLLAKSNQSSPVHRGVFVRERLFCTPPPPPPPDLQIEPPEVSPTATTRERFAQHQTVPVCAACHKLLDPIGLGFEAYDGVGRWRTTENGRVIDSSGEILGTDVAGTFTGTVQLGARLAGSRDVAACMTKVWFEYVFGRSPAPEDACAIEQMNTKFAASGFRLRDLLRAAVESDAFLYTRVGGAP